MKRSFTSFFLMAVCFVLFESFGGDGSLNYKYPSGSPGGFTNSPGDGHNCTNCHGGTATAVTGWVTSNVPASGYIPGSVYQITITATGSGNKGFECSPQTTAGALVGTVAAGTGQVLCNGNKAVTHSATHSQNPYSWTFNWTAPATGVGNVTFYASIVVAKANTKTTTLVISQDVSSGIIENELSSYSIYPNPMTDHLNVSFSLKSSENVTFDLYSLDGKFVTTLANGTFQSGSHLMNLITPIELAGGIYLLQVNAGNERKVSRIVVQ